MKNEQELHVSNIKGDYKETGMKEIYAEPDTFALLNETFRAKNFNKSETNKGKPRMEGPLRFQTGADTKGEGTYVFPFNNATLYVQFEPIFNEDGTPHMILNETDGKEYPEKLRHLIMTPDEADMVVKPIVIPF